MTFISYGQNGEDVLLWRVLGEIRDGFYIDVGANDPWWDSITKNFYDNGWRGINIEPSVPVYTSLVEQRPRDINLCLAVGSRCGDVTFYEFEGAHGLSTVEKSVAEMHRAGGYTVHERIVPMVTLDSICEEHVRSDIHFLKIDVEGSEGEVLRGIDLTRWRPWILLVEATAPIHGEPTHEGWEPYILEAGYKFAYFDGLNRFYVSNEKADLIAKLACQPNVFDDYVSRRLAHAEQAIIGERDLGRLIQSGYDALEQQHAALQQQHSERLAECARLNERIAALLVDLDVSRRQAALLQAELEGARAQVTGMMASSSWKLTAPFRWGVSLIRRAIR
jgi:FkbM family methyltransferase